MIFLNLSINYMKRIRNTFIKHDIRVVIIFKENQDTILPLILNVNEYFEYYIIASKHDYTSEDYLINEFIIRNYYNCEFEYICYYVKKCGTFVSTNCDYLKNLDIIFREIKNDIENSQVKEVENNCIIEYQNQ